MKATSILLLSNSDLKSFVIITCATLLLLRRGRPVREDMEYIFKNTHLQTFPEPIAFKILKESDVDYIKGTSFVEKIYMS